MAQIAKVAIVSPLPQLNHLFDFLIPRELETEISFGVRVRVSLGRSSKLLDAFVTEISDNSEFPGKLAPICEVVSSKPVLTPEILKLCNEMAVRTASNLGEILKAAIPAHMPRSLRALDKSIEQGRNQLPPASTNGLERGERRAHLAQPRIATSAVKGFSAPEWVLEFAEISKAVLSRGESVLILVPDYRDQAAMEIGLRHTELDPWLVDYSQEQAKSKRYSNFLRLLEPSPVIAIGTRSAALAPVHKLGAILVWDEADPSFTDPGAPYLNARDVALVRQQQSGCALMFSAHSRSTDIQRLVEVGYLTESGGEFPKAQIVFSEPGLRVDSLAFQTIKSGLESGSVLVQVASKGFSSSLYCKSCEKRAFCSTCGGPLWIDSNSKIRCRWCNSFQLGIICSCGSTELMYGRAGSTRTAAELGKAFPNARIIESTGENRVLEVSKDNSLVVATAGAEPSTPSGYSAVVILDAQAALSRQSLRAHEIAVREWANAVAKLGPNGKAVLVGMAGKLGQSFALWQQREIASEELSNRRELALPPVIKLGSLEAPLEILESIRAELNSSEVLTLLGPAPLDSSVEERWRLMFKYAYSSIHEVSAQIRAAVAKVTAGKVAISKSGRTKRSVQIRMSDAEVI